MVTMVKIFAFYHVIFPRVSVPTSKMKRFIMNHSHLRAFHAVAITGGFTTAANHLGMTQPSVSLQVLAMEKQYQTALFHRQGKFIRLTSSGEKLLTLSSRYFKIEQEADHLLKSLADNLQGMFRIAADQANRIFPHATDFKTLFPSIQLEINVLPTQQLLEELLDYHHDLIICGEPVTHEHLDCHMIMKEVMSTTVPVGHPLTALPAMIAPDLHDLAIFLYDEPSASTQRIYQWLLKNDIKVPQIMFCENRELAIEAVAHGEGITFLPQKHLLSDRRLSSVPFEDCPLYHEEYIIHQKKTMMSRFINGLTQNLAVFPV